MCGCQVILRTITPLATWRRAAEVRSYSSHKRNGTERTSEGTAFPLSLYLCKSLRLQKKGGLFMILYCHCYIHTLSDLGGDLFHATKFLPWIEKSSICLFFPLKPFSAVNLKQQFHFKISILDFFRRCLNSGSLYEYIWVWAWGKSLLSQLFFSSLLAKPSSQNEKFVHHVSGFSVNQWCRSTCLYMKTLHPEMPFFKPELRNVYDLIQSQSEEKVWTLVLPMILTLKLELRC